MVAVTKRLSGFPGHLPGKLAYCTSDALRIEWVRAALGCGATLTDVGLWLGGVDDPSGLIRSLIREGMVIVTFRKRTRDAAGDQCTVVAWRLREEAADVI